jgi:hypothetical protein
VMTFGAFCAAVVAVVVTELMAQGMMQNLQSFPKMP